VLLAKALIGRDAVVLAVGHRADGDRTEPALEVPVSLVRRMTKMIPPIDEMAAFAAIERCRNVSWQRDIR